MRTTYILIKFLLLCSLLSSCSNEENTKKIEREYRKYRQSFAEVPEMTLEQSKKLDREKVIFIDVREDAERNVSMLPKAIGQAAFEANEEIYKDHKLIVYCTIGYRSGLFARELRKKNLDAYNLRGGILAWLDDGGKVFKDNKEVKKVHVYGSRWNYVPKGYEAQW